MEEFLPIFIEVHDPPLHRLATNGPRWHGPGGSSVQLDVLEPDALNHLETASFRRAPLATPKSPQDFPDGIGQFVPYTSPKADAIEVRNEALNNGPRC